jgi:hypothetical protein
LGYGPYKNKHHSGRHRWVRRESNVNPQLAGRVRPVLLRAPLPTDFCSFCRVKRELLEAAV